MFLIGLLLLAKLADQYTLGDNMDMKIKSKIEIKVGETKIVLTSEEARQLHYMLRKELKLEEPFVMPWVQPVYPYPWVPCITVTATSLPVDTGFTCKDPLIKSFEVT